MVVQVQRTVTIAMHHTLVEMSKMEYHSEICDEAVGLLMTYRCNLNCKYCYVQIKRNKDMTLEMAQNILGPFLNKTGGLVDITFMGGETLMAIDVIRPLVEWVEKGKWNRHYRFLGATNGTLLNDEIKAWLVKYKHVFTLGLSYDGLPSVQNENRGNEEIDIDFFINTWPHQPIQMTINADSVDKMAEGIIYLLERGGTVHPNVAFEQTEWPKIKVKEYGRQLNKLIEYYRLNDDKPLISPFIHNLNEYAYCIDHPRKQLEVCGAGNGFQVFDIDGESYPCHILSPLVLMDNKLQEVKKGLISKTTDFSDTDCAHCPYTSSCPTCLGCNFLYRNKLQKRDKTHCLIMKTEVRAFIKKEVLRLKEKRHLSSDDATEIDSICRLVEYEKTRKITKC